jgi:hypothetical protein
MPRLDRLPNRARPRFAVANYFEVFDNRQRLHSAPGYRAPDAKAHGALLWLTPLSHARCHGAVDLQLPSFPIFPMLVRLAEPAGATAGATFHWSEQLTNAPLPFAVFTS